MREEAWIESIVATTLATTWPPWPATSQAEAANVLAWRALSPLWRTAAIICPIRVLIKAASSELTPSGAGWERSA